MFLNFCVWEMFNVKWWRLRDRQANTDVTQAIKIKIKTNHVILFYKLYTVYYNSVVVA